MGSLRIVRSAIEQGRLEWEEYSHFGMITRLQAGASGLPFLPMNQTGATDLEKANPNIKRIHGPYGGKDVIVVPALNPDVAIVHVQRADNNGNAHLWGIIGEQKEAAFAAKKVILTAEEIVDEMVIRSDPNRTMIPGIVVSAVCHVPFACHPSYAQGYYDRATSSISPGIRSANLPKRPGSTWTNGSMGWPIEMSTGKSWGQKNTRAPGRAG